MDYDEDYDYGDSILNQLGELSDSLSLFIQGTPILLLIIASILFIFSLFMIGVIYRLMSVIHKQTLQIYKIEILLEERLPVITRENPKEETD